VPLAQPLSRELSLAASAVLLSAASLDLKVVVASKELSSVAASVPWVATPLAMPVTAVAVTTINQSP
jgi:hypothetical protein